MEATSLNLRDKIEMGINKMNFLKATLWSSSLKLTLNICTWLMIREFISSRILKSEEKLETV